MRKPILAIGLLAAMVSCKPSASNQANEATTADSTVVAQADTITADDRGYIVQVGQTAPDFTMTLTDGTEVRLSDLRGKVVMLQFTASWCGVCHREMPFIESDIWQKHRSNPRFALYAIDREEPIETVLEFTKQTGITYPIALDPDGDHFALYADRQAGITRNVILNPEGEIVMLTRLFNDEEFASMTQVIEEQLAALND